MEKEMVNHPQHYNDFDVEVIDMMSRIWGDKETAIFCKLNAFKYRMRAGLKNDANEDLKKADWYINKYHLLIDKHDINESNYTEINPTFDNKNL